MKTLTLKNKFQTNVTLIANDFIDTYMVKANGEFVKVYLFLLRHLDDPCSSFTVSMIADFLNNTENDILRAFRFWESEGLLTLETDAEGRITCVELEHTASHMKNTVPVPQPVSDTSQPLAPVPIPEKPVHDSGTILLDSFKAQKELKSLLFIAEQYLGKTLSGTDVDAITYFYDELGMSADLIEYLIESCVENGHKSIHYIQKVGMSWTDEGIVTVEQARQRSLSYNKNCYTVLNAFGIKNRGPAATELTYIRNWADELGFTLDIIQEACSRTIAATHQPSFEYADSILKKWHEKQVHSLKDIETLDIAFQKEKNARKPVGAKTRPSTKNMNNFERRTYDMESLEDQLLNSN